MEKHLRMEEVGDELILWEDNPLQSIIRDGSRRDPRAQRFLFRRSAR
jgi:hypothetical protein